MITAFSDLDVSGVTRRSQQARGGVVVEIVGQVSDGAIPGLARKPALGCTGIALRPGLQDIEQGIRSGCGSYARGRENGLQVSSSHHRVNFRNVLLNFVAEALYQTAC